MVDSRVRLPQLDNLRWRVDVTISNRYSQQLCTTLFTSLEIKSADKIYNTLLS